jgi:hypothetical protein
MMATCKIEKKVTENLSGFRKQKHSNTKISTLFDINCCLYTLDEIALSRECCIYRVLIDLRKLNKEAYTLQVISIGPFHHGVKRLETMGRNKEKYFKIFVKKTELNVENLVSTIRNRKAEVRHCYLHTSRLNNDDYVKIILLDASFIIIFFLELCVE